MERLHATDAKNSLKEAFASNWDMLAEVTVTVRLRNTIEIAANIAVYKSALPWA